MLMESRVFLDSFTLAWEQRKLKDVVDVCSGRDYKHLKEGNIPVYGTGGYMLSVDEALSYDKDAIGIGRKGTIDKPYILKAPFWTVDTLFYAIPSDDSELNFVYDIFQNIDWKKKDESTGVPSLSKIAINDIDVLVPCLKEQLEIGNYFRNLDHLITLHQCKESAFSEWKDSGFLQKYKTTWEQRKFSDIVARESSISTSTTDIPSVEYEDVVAEEGRLNKDVHLKETVKSGITFDGSQVLYGKLRPYLHNWLNPDFKGIAVGDWWVLKPINIDKKFLYRLIQTQQFDNIANQSSGSKMPRADWNLISNSEFTVPFSKEEQSKIGRYFDSLDNLITLHQRKPFCINRRQKWKQTTKMQNYSANIMQNGFQYIRKGR